MVNYSLGKVYKIVGNGKIYVGSTCKKLLCQRLAAHNSAYKKWKEGKTNYMTSFQIIERGNYSYSLIETVVCEDRKQLEQRERYYIENNYCINKNIPGRTVKERYEANRDDKKEYDKIYRKNNIDKKKATDNAYSATHKVEKKEYDRQRRAKAKQLNQEQQVR